VIENKALDAQPEPGEPAAPDEVEPAVPNGGVEGSLLDPTSRQAEPANDAPTTAPAQEHHPSAASLLGLPDSLPLTWCPNCKADVQPKGKGYCPRCARMLKGSFLARKHPVNMMRRDALLKRLTDDYRPNTTLLQSHCETLAGIIEQLEVLKPGSPEHQRLVQQSQALGAALEEAQSARSTDTHGTDRVPTSALQLARDLLQRVARGETLSEREQGRLDVLRDAMRGDVQLPDLIDVPADKSLDTGVGGASRDAPRPTPAPRATPAPEPVEALCPYCKRPIVVCNKQRLDRPDVWAIACSMHPDVREAERKRQTDIMYATFRHGSGISRW